MALVPNSGLTSLTRNSEIGLPSLPSCLSGRQIQFSPDQNVCKSDVSRAQATWAVEGRCGLAAPVVYFLSCRSLAQISFGSPVGSAESARVVLYDWMRMGRNRLGGTSLGSSAALPWRGPWRHAHSNPPTSASVSRESERGPLRSTYFQPASP
jgi:hypothetical protein